MISWYVLRAVWLPVTNGPAYIIVQRENQMNGIFYYRIEGVLYGTAADSICFVGNEEECHRWVALQRLQ